MIAKEHALDRVNARAVVYSNTLKQAEVDRQLLAEACFEASKAGAKQQQIADKTVVPENDFDLSRQRISQFLNGQV
jgi:hypothetical protein